MPRHVFAKIIIVMIVIVIVITFIRTTLREWHVDPTGSDPRIHPDLKKETEGFLVTVPTIITNERMNINECIITKSEHCIGNCDQNGLEETETWCKHTLVSI